MVLGVGGDFLFRQDGQDNNIGYGSGPPVFVIVIVLVLEILETMTCYDAPPHQFVFRARARARLRSGEIRLYLMLHPVHPV
jgi:hypothetical protein